MIRRIQEDDVLARSFLGELAEAQRHNDRIEEALSVFDNYVDPRDAYRDSDGTDWSVLGAGVGGKNRPATDFAGFANEQELTDARELCRRMFTNNEFVINGHNVRVNYAVDTGFQFKAVAKDASKANPELVYQLQEFIDELLEENHWARRQRETVLRYDRDGEAFRRRFRQPDGLTMYRFIEPWQVTSLSIDETSRNLAFGVECEPDDDEKPVRYYVATISGENPQAIDAEDVQHLKANVDMNVRRGVPLFWPAGRNARRVTSVLRNVGIKDELAAALCVNRKHSSATTGTAASAFASGAATLRTTNPSTGAVTNHKAYGPGTILDTSKNTEYEALNIADGIDQMVMGLDAMLRALAAAAGLPEFMLTSNASNGNYSSTMVAEGPAVRTFRTIQSMLKAADLELIDDAIEWAIQCKRLPEGILDEVEIQVELPQLSTRDAAAEANANKTYLDAKVLSRQTLSSKLGLEYDQEQENIKAHDMAHPPEPSPMLGNPNDPNRAAAVGAMRGIMRTPESMDAFKALLDSEYRAVCEHLGPGAHPNGTSQDVHGDGGSIERQVKAMTKSLGGKQPMTQKRAANVDGGGEIGPNGEFYRPGAFIATTDLPKKLKDKLKSSAIGKVVVEPGVFEVPKPGQMSLLDKLGGTVMNHRNGEINYQYLSYRGSTPEEVANYENLVGRWKAGERWVSVTDHPELAGFTDVARLYVAEMNIPDVLLSKLPDEYRTRLKVREGVEVTEHCGANAQGGGGFQPGNTCGGEGGGGAVDAKKKITDSAAFKAWFGDSKVVDADGKPLVVYHGTQKDFDEFKVTASSRNGDAFGVGHYFGSSDVANVYADKEEFGPNVKPVYLKIEAPFDLGSKLTDGQVQAIAAAVALDPPMDGDMTFAATTTKEFSDKKSAMEFFTGKREEWKSKGNGIDRHKPSAGVSDGGAFTVTYKDLSSQSIHIPAMASDAKDALQRVYGNEYTHVLKRAGFDGIKVPGLEFWIAFDSTQIKSATGNKGTFDPSNPDIREGFDPSEHPRHDAGTSQGGEFAPKGAGGAGNGIAPDYVKGEHAAGVLDDWATPATGSREGNYAKAKAEAEAWVNGEKSKGFDELYAETQAGLKSRGIKEAKLYRGIALPADHPLAKAIASGDVGKGTVLKNVSGMAVTSWSDSNGVAEHFATSERLRQKGEAYAVVLERVVSAEDVIGTHKVHRGFLPGENEWIARNKGKVELRVVAAWKPIGMSEGVQDGSADGIDLSGTDNQRGIEKPKDA